MPRAESSKFAVLKNKEIQARAEKSYGVSAVNLEYMVSNTVLCLPPGEARRGLKRVRGEVDRHAVFPDKTITGS